MTWPFENDTSAIDKEAGKTQLKGWKNEKYLDCPDDFTFRCIDVRVGSVYCLYADCK